MTDKTVRETVSRLSMIITNDPSERHSDVLKTVLSLHAIALDGMAEGLCVVDGEFRIVLFNRRLLDMLDLPRDAVRVGASLKSVLELVIDPAAASSDCHAQMWRTLEQMFTQDEAFDLNRRTSRGALVRFCFQPTTGGGWVATCAPADRQALEQTPDVGAAGWHKVFAASSRGMCVYGGDKRLVLHNDPFLRLYSFNADEITPGMSYLDILALAVERDVYADLAPGKLLEAHAALFASEPRTQQLALSDGRTVKVTVRPTGNGWLAEYEDVTEHMRRERALHERNQLLDATLEHMAHGLCAYDQELRLIVVNRRYLEMYGLTENDAKPGTSLLDLMSRSVALGIHRPGTTAEEMYQDFKQRLIENKEPVLRRFLSDGRVIAVRHRPMASGGWVGTYEDITERHRAEENIAHMARHDTLTALPNRLLFHEKMADGLVRVAGGNAAMAVMCLDLDNFKTVNDSLGHPIGDKLLQGVAQRLCETLTGADTIARLGGDEFAILHRVKSVHEAESLARRAISVVSEPIMIDGQEITTSISIGIAIAPDNGTTSEHLMKCADLALYRSKDQGRNTYRCFEPAMDAQLQARRTLETDLRRALAGGEFDIAYQPQISLASNELIGFEALLRWNHPVRGPVSPAEFIPVAEEIGLIIPIGQWVLRHACAEAAKWPGALKIAVNLSPVQFRGRGLVSTVTQALAAANLSANRLELEITEAVLMEHNDANLSTLHQLRALGARIAMDDFGTGYSSLSYLRSFPFDKIKIDRSFVLDSIASEQGEAIIRTIAELGSTLGIETTAEGIETAEQLQLVRRTGCTEGQGYLIGRPTSRTQVLEFIAGSRRGAAAA
jgi:diguanylate cyclase (GGDEF)-like protein/PAS domain S-box-containing protein